MVTRIRLAHGLALADLTWIFPVIDLLESRWAILFQSHHTHLRLAAIASEAELHDRTSGHIPQRSNPVGLEDEPRPEEHKQGILIDEAGVTDHDENTGLALRVRLLRVLDPVVRDLDVVPVDHERAGTGPTRLHERGGGLGRKEDDLGRSGDMLPLVGLVDVRAPNTAEVADRPEQLRVGDVRRQVCQPKSTVLLW